MIIVIKRHFAQTGCFSSVTILLLNSKEQCEYHSFGSAYEYVDVYPNAAYVFIENAGHEIWWEQGEKYLEEIRNFLDR